MMLDLFLGNKMYFLLLIGLGLAVAFLFHYMKWKKEKKSLFASSKFQNVLFEKNSKFSKIFPILYILSIVFLIIAMVDVLGGKEEIKTQQKTSNVIFLLDISNSMNAQDVEPSRLEQARNIVVNTLQQLKGDRIGIVVFGGDAFSVMPLTTDYSAAETYIGGIETQAMPVQGTDFLRAMEVVVSKFKNIPKGARKVVMISDGEDNEGNEDAAIKLANSEGISVTTVGIGKQEGAPIPDYFYGQLMGYKTDVMGTTVMSKLEESALKNIASSTGGNYLSGNDLDDAVNEIVKDVRDDKTSSKSYITSNTAEHYFQYVLGIALLFLMIIFLFNPKKDFNI